MSLGLLADYMTVHRDIAQNKCLSQLYIYTDVKRVIITRHAEICRRASLTVMSTVM